MRIRFAAAWVLTAACGGDASSRASNGDVTLRDYACASCKIVAESIAYLGDPRDTIALREDVIPSRDSRGRFYLADLKGGMVYVFGPDGRLMRSIGKPGRGPGEFASLRAVFVAAHDTLYVAGGPTIHVISPEYQEAREYRYLGGSVDEIASTMLADGRILSPRSQHEFLLIDSTGRTDVHVKLQSIDASRCGECGERIYREANAPGSIWSGPLNTYRVERHDISGKLLQRFIRRVSWYPDWGAREIEARTVVVELSRPRLMGARQGTDGIVWTHVSGADKVDDLGNVDEDIPKQMAGLWERIRTHVEAIDPVKGELLAGTVIDGMVIPMTGDYSAQLVVDDAGGWAWKILRFRVERGK